MSGAIVYAQVKNTVEISSCNFNNNTNQYAANDNLGSLFYFDESNNGVVSDCTLTYSGGILYLNKNNVVVL